VLGSFDTTAQHNLQAFLSGTAVALAGRGQDLNNAIGNLDPAITQLSALVGALNEQQSNIRSVINNGGIVLTTLGDRSADLQSLITAGNQVFSATAAENASLTATVNALVPFDVQLRTTLLSLNTTLGIAKPTLAVLRPVAPLLPPALSAVIQLSGPATALLREAPSLFSAANAALPAITRFSQAFKPAVDVLLPAAQQLAPIITFVAQYRQELVAAMGNLAADLQAKSSAVTSTGSASYLRAASVLGPESIYGQTVREPDNRSNTYFSPGELANVGKGGLLSANCDNTRNVSQVPLTHSNVRCRVQPPFKWGNGILTSYYPHVTQAKVPKK
jgi:phospholipid/cholesterol/gamma-HCH transport system substrate-binding protein